MIVDFGSEAAGAPWREGREMIAALTDAPEEQSADP